MGIFIFFDSCLSTRFARTPIFKVFKRGAGQYPRFQMGRRRAASIIDLRPPISAPALTFSASGNSNGFNHYRKQRAVCGWPQRDIFPPPWL